MSKNNFVYQTAHFRSFSNLVTLLQSTRYIKDLFILGNWRKRKRIPCFLTFEPLEQVEWSCPRRCLQSTRMVPSWFHAGIGPASADRYFRLWYLLSLALFRHWTSISWYTPIYATYFCFPYFHLGFIFLLSQIFKSSVSFVSAFNSIQSETWKLWEF